MKKDNEYFQKLLDWLKKEHPEKYSKYLDNIVLENGEISVNHKYGISEVNRQILIRIIDKHPPFK